MKYPGGKKRLGHKIAKHIMSMWALDGGERPYLEPFVGMAGVFSRVDVDMMIGSDASEDVIAFLKAVCDGWVPPIDITEEDYARWRTDPEPSAMRCFVGHACSWGGKWWGGYARGTNGSGGQRNYALEGKNAIRELRPGLLGKVLKVADHAGNIRVQNRERDVENLFVWRP